MSEFTSAQKLWTVANRLRFEEGGKKAAGRLICMAAVVLLLSGARPDEINEVMADAIRDLDKDDNGERH